MGRNNRRRNAWRHQPPVLDDDELLQPESQTTAAITQIPPTPPITPINGALDAFHIPRPIPQPAPPRTDDGDVTHCTTLALNRLSVSSNNHRYRCVHAILFRWIDGDLDDIETLKRVAIAFDEYCDAGVVIYGIPSIEPYAFVEDVLHAAKKEYCSPDDLIIVYYNGHGYLNEDQKMIWWANNNEVEKGPAVDWYALQVGLERHRSEVLIILATCASGGSFNVLDDNVLTEGGMTELIASCGYEATSTNGFTEILVSELRALEFRDRDFTAQFLCQQILRRMIQQNRDAISSNGSSTPIYLRLNGDQSAPGILLRPFRSSYH